MERNDRCVNLGRNRLQVLYRLAFLRRWNLRQDWTKWWKRAMKLDLPYADS